jgi:hypothetical protein
MTWLQLIAWTAGILFAIAAVGALGIIALFALADREAAKQPPRKKRP